MASTTTTEEKRQLRRRIAEREALWSPEQRRRSDELLLRRFLALPQIQESPVILLFYGMGSEPDTRRLFQPLLEQGKALGLPRCLPGGQMEFRRYLGEEHMVRHPYGMMEPGEDCPVLPARAASAALIPAVCYDVSCLRLGRGGGYYDRFLTGYQGFTVGLCREAFLQPECPGEVHDRRVSLVLTEGRSFQNR